MAITEIEELPADSTYLLALFKRDVHQKLVQAGIDAIRPALDKAANDTLASMKIRIEKNLDIMQDRTLVAIIVDGVKQP